MEKISVIVPCYNEEESIPLFYDEIKRVRGLMTDYAFEVIFVDDGSRDRSLELMRELAEKDEEIRYISFSRNFGKEAAMYAGLKNAAGDYVVMMICRIRRHCCLKWFAASRKKAMILLPPAE